MGNQIIFGLLFYCRLLCWDGTVWGSRQVFSCERSERWSGATQKKKNKLVSFSFFGSLSYTARRNSSVWILDIRRVRHWGCQCGWCVRRPIRMWFWKKKEPDRVCAIWLGDWRLAILFVQPVHFRHQRGHVKGFLVVLAVFLVFVDDFLKSRHVWFSFLFFWIKYELAYLLFGFHFWFSYFPIKNK